MKEREIKPGKRFGELLERLKALNLSPDQYAIFGSGPMAIRGLRDPYDLDLVVTPTLRERLAKSYPVKEYPWGYTIQLAETVQALSQPSFGLDAEELIERADIISGIRFVKLTDIITWKRGMNRPKDLEDIELIQKYLRQTP